MIIVYASLASAFLIGILGGLLFSRKRRIPGTPLTHTVIVACAVAAGLLTGLNVAAIATAEAYQNWPVVAAIVTGGEITGGRSYIPEVYYTYEFHGRQYSGVDTIYTPGFGGKRKRLDVAETELAGHPPGSEITMYVNPDNPEETRMSIGLSYKVYMQLGLGVFLLAVTLFLLLGLTGKNFNPPSRRHQSGPASSP